MTGLGGLRNVPENWWQQYPGWGHVPPSTWRSKQEDQPLPDEDLALLENSGITFSRLLGKGGFGEVWLSRIERFHSDSRGDPQPAVFACKITGLKIHFPKRQLRLAVEEMLRELTILSRVEHPHLIHMEHVVRLYDERHAFPHPYYTLCFIELCHSSLKQLVLYLGRMPEPVANQMFMQVVQALHYLHTEANIAHLDIKPENVLFKEHPDNKDYVKFKLSDFGLAHAYNPGEPPLTSQFGGTEMFMPPEMKAQSLSMDAFKCDVYSLAVTLSECLTGVTKTDPPNCVRVIQMVASNVKFKMISEDLQHLLRAMTSPEPQNRFDITQVLEHRWTQNVGYFPGSYVSITGQ